MENSVLAGYENGEVALWDIGSGTPVYFRDSLIGKAHYDLITAIDISDNGKYATATQTGEIKIWTSPDTLTHRFFISESNQKFCPFPSRQTTI